MKIGDTVRFLDDVGGGIITRIEGKTVYVTDADGFDTPTLITRCVLVPSAPAPTAAEVVPKSTPQPKPQPTPVAKLAQAQHLPALPSATLIFEPHEIKRLSQSTFDLYLVNDSALSLQFAVMCHDRLDGEWHLLDAGECAPGEQAFICELMQGELNQLEHIAVQLQYFQRQGAFELRAPIGFETRFDVTRLAKLHCFASTAYSATPVVTIPIVNSGRVVGPVNFAELVDSRGVSPKAEPQTPQRPAKTAPKGPEVIDLHIDALLDSHSGMAPAEILALQIDTIERKMTEAARRPGSELIFIHGKGEGVLRKALLDHLRRRWPRSEARDASFLEYGFGATHVLVRK